MGFVLYYLTQTTHFLDIPCIEMQIKISWNIHVNLWNHKKQFSISVKGIIRTVAVFPDTYTLSSRCLITIYDATLNRYNIEISRILCTYLMRDIRENFLTVALLTTFPRVHYRLDTKCKNFRCQCSSKTITTAFRIQWHTITTISIYLLYITYQHAMYGILGVLLFKQAKCNIMLILFIKLFKK